jgi:hypothetical protein
MVQHMVKPIYMILSRKLLRGRLMLVWQEHVGILSKVVAYV